MLAVAAATLIALGGASWSLGTALRDTVGLIRAPGRTSIDELVIAVSAGSALLLLLWVTLGLLTSVVATLPGPVGAMSGRMRDSIAPEAVRRWAALLLGVAVVSACAPGGAVASEVGSVRALDGDTASSAPAPLWVEPAPLWTDPTPTSTGTPETSTAPATSTPAAPPPVTVTPAPEWTPTPVRSLPPVTLTAPRPPADDRQDEVTVRRGDTLWDLAASHLSPGATDAEVATAWQRWYATNRHIIGPDPDLILPGQVLTVPAAAEAAPAGGSR